MKPVHLSKWFFLAEDVVSELPLISTPPARITKPTHQTANIGGKATYYRPKTPHSHSLNFLVGAAHPLLILLAHAPLLCLKAAPERLFQDLIREIQTFESNLASSYSANISRIAGYLLCVVLDEVILSQLKRGSISPTFRLLQSFYQEDRDEKRFFKIIFRLMKDPEPVLELLELAYLCLSLSHQHLLFPSLQATHELLIDGLYHRLQSTPTEISSQPITPIKLKDQQRIRLLKYISAGSTLLLALYALCTLGTSYYTAGLIKAWN